MAGLPRRRVDQRRAHARGPRRARGRGALRLPALRPDARARDRPHGRRQQAVRPLPHARHRRPGRACRRSRPPAGADYEAVLRRSRLACARRAGSPGCRAAWRRGSSTPAEPPWPRPYALFVGTVESRKNHAAGPRGLAAADRARGAEHVPDLVCIGRLGLACRRLPRRVRAHPRPGRQGERAVEQRARRRAGRASTRMRTSRSTPPATRAGGCRCRRAWPSAGCPSSRDNSSLPEAGRDLAAYFASRRRRRLRARRSRREALDAEARRAGRGAHRGGHEPRRSPGSRSQA